MSQKEICLKTYHSAISKIVMQYLVVALGKSTNSFESYLGKVSQVSTRESTNVVGDVSVPFAIRNMQNNIHVP